MRKVFLTSVLVTVAIVSQLHAQSGSRGGGRLGRENLQRLAQQQAQIRQQLAQQSVQFREEQAKQQFKQAKQQFKQALTQLAGSDSRAANSRQFRIALDEAKRDYKSLRKQQVDPSFLGALKEPFRLTKNEIDRENRTANWPTSLQDSEFATLVASVDTAIRDRAVKDEESATQFLNDLGELNTALNRAAAGGRVNISNFAKARRFISGLANEVRATDLVM